jgi:hypothetical protein
VNPFRAWWRLLRSAFVREPDYGKAINRFEDGSPRPRISDAGPTTLQLVKGLQPGKQPASVRRSGK